MGKGCYWWEGVKWCVGGGRRKEDITNGLTYNLMLIANI